MKSKEIVPPPAPTQPDASINNTKTKDTTECNRCKSHVARDTVYSCPILCCLEHCAAYMSVNFNDRSLCVENANWCPIHLLHTHSLQECNTKNEACFKCGIGNCKKHHHKTLHVATIPLLANINSAAANQHLHSKSCQKFRQRLICTSI